MSYLSPNPEYPNKQIFNLKGFVADLAAEMGGKVIAKEPEYNLDITGVFAVGELVVFVRAAWNDKTKVSLSVREVNRQWLAGNEPSGPDYRTPEIRVSVDRPLKT